MRKAYSRLSARTHLVFLLGITLFLHGCSSIYQPLPGPARTYPKSPQVKTVPSSQYPVAQPDDKEPAVQAIPEPPRPVPPTSYSARTGAAGSLFEQSRQLMARGNYRQAELTLERALRIEPRNGYYWYAMADLKYRQNQNSKAVQFCLKSKSLAGGDRNLIRLNENLIQMAQ